MKILLINPFYGEIKNSRLPLSLSAEVGAIMPLGLASIAGYLRQKGIDVEILDAQANQILNSQIQKKIKESRADIIGLTSMTPTVHQDLDICVKAKELGKIVVLGGPQINAMPQEMLKIPVIDYGIKGEGEYPFYLLVEALKNKKSVRAIPGLVFRDESGAVIENPPYIHPNLDDLPLPARDLLPFEKYFSLISEGRLATLVPSRGCPFHCGFCFKQPSDTLIRFRSPQLVVDEIEALIAKFQINEINFVSDTFSVKKDFVEGLCSEILKRKIKISWIAPTRIGSVDYDLLKLMKSSGCRSLRFGIESGSEKILQLMNKPINKEETIKVFKWTKDIHLETFAYLIIGYIGETEGTIKETMSFIKKIQPDLIMYNIATPLPKTPLFDQAVKAGLVAPDYWSQFLKDPTTPRINYLFPDAEKWAKIAYREFYFSPKFLFKQATKIRPNNLMNHLRALRGLIKLQL